MNKNIQEYSEQSSMALIKIDFCSDFISIWERHILL